MYSFNFHILNQFCLFDTKNQGLALSCWRDIFATLIYTVVHLYGLGPHTVPLCFSILTYGINQGQICV